jgi:hypothetical protein
MPTDPAAPYGLTLEQRLLQDVADLKREVATLKRGGGGVQVTAGTPTVVPREGALAADSSAVRLWVRVGGAWRYTPLT